MNDFIMGLLYGGFAVSSIFLFRQHIFDLLFDIKLWFEYDYTFYLGSKKIHHNILASFITAMTLVPILSALLLGLINLMFILFATTPYYPSSIEFLSSVSLNIGFWTMLLTITTILKNRKVGKTEVMIVK